MTSPRTFDWDLDFLFVKKDGRILLEGEVIGSVARVENPPTPAWRWRAERGDPANPDQWPTYRATYGRTRDGAVRALVDGLEIPA